MKIKLPKLKSAFQIIFAAVISSLLISTVLISLPQTEKVYDKARYDITLSPEVWKKEYTLELTIKAKDFNKRDKKVSETKSIIEKRLKKYGVQEVQIKEIASNSRDKAVLLIRVETDKDESSVDQLVSQRYYARFVLRKEGVNFEDPTNQFAQFDIENYVNTPYSLHEFRQVYITTLRSSTGEDAYFSIYKPWEHKAGEFYSYFDKYAGQYAGIAIDGFVSPILVPITNSGQTSGIVARNPFAIGMNGDADDAEVLSILSNTGVIPVEYSQTATKDLASKSIEVDYIKMTILFSTLSATILILLYVLNKRGTYTTFISYALTATTFIAVSKLLGIPLQPIVLLYTNITLTFLLPIFIASKQVTVALALLGLLLYFLGAGFMQNVGIVMFYVLTTYIIMQYVVSHLGRLINTIMNND